MVMLLPPTITICNLVPDTTPVVPVVLPSLLIPKVFDHAD